MAMNSSVDGRQDRPDDFEAMAAVREFHRLGIRVGVVFPQEPEQRASVATNTMPVSQRMNMNRWSMLWPASDTSAGKSIADGPPVDEHADAEDRHEQEDAGSRFSHACWGEW